MRKMIDMLPSPLRRLAPYHILLLGALLGMQLYQSLVNTRVAFRAIPMPQFIGYQKTIFPIYFQLHLVLIPLVAITYPNASVAGLLREKGLWVPLAAGMGCALANCLVWGPRCLEAMLERGMALFASSREEYLYLFASTIERQKTGAEGSIDTPTLAEKVFSKNHAMVIHLNFISIICVIWYCFVLGSRVTVRGATTA
jgi:hypothetical protein